MVIVGSRTLQMLLEHPEFPPKQVSIVHLVLWFFASRDCRLDQTLKDFASATNEIKASVVLAIWRSLFHARMLAGSRSPNSVGLVYDLVVTPGSYQFNLPSSCSKGFLKFFLSTSEKTMFTLQFLYTSSIIRNLLQAIFLNWGCSLLVDGTRYGKGIDSSDE